MGNPNQNETIVELLQLLVKHYIYVCRNSGIKPSNRGLMSSLKNYQSVEKQSAIKNNTMDQYFMKWNNINF